MAKQTPVQARAAWGIVSRAEPIRSFSERRPYRAAPTVCFILLSRSVFFRPACTSRSICDHLLSLSVYSIKFSSIYDPSGLESSFSSSRDKILSCASTGPDSFCLSPSYASFQRHSKIFGEGDVGTCEVAGRGRTGDCGGAGRWTEDAGPAASWGELMLKFVGGVGM